MTLYSPHMKFIKIFRIYFDLFIATGIENKKYKKLKETIFVKWLNYCSMDFFMTVETVL